jgi:hypothetical protein
MDRDDPKIGRSNVDNWAFHSLRPIPGGSTGRSFHHVLAEFSGGQVNGSESRSQLLLDDYPSQRYFMKA